VKALVSALSMVALLGGCKLSPEASPCNEIPDGGCPGIDNTNCVDPSCAAIYTCNPNETWSRAAVCPPQDAGADAPRPMVLDAAPKPRDAALDVPGALGVGCADLEQPDCPVEEAVICATDCCGCQYLYVCLDAGWYPWGSCIDGGVVALDGGF
jgi:hypothetical protein